MALRLIYCAVFDGLEAKEVEVEVSFTRSLPAFQITGLAGSTIQEARQRVQSSLLSNGFKFPPLKIVVNLSPSDLPKQGSFYDLPIALLIALYDYSDLQEIENKKESITWFAFGELGLDGKVKDTPFIYPLLFSLLSKSENTEAFFILSKSAENFYSKIPNLKAYYVDTLQEGIEILRNPPPLEANNADLPFLFEEILGERYYFSTDFPLDFSDIVGQERAKRAALIAACGFHNILFEGSAGSGKSMIATRIPYILPPLKREEILQMAANTLKISPFRPFRNPHNSATKAAILGSAVNQSIKQGEIALAHLGVLFFDEIPHFPKNILESMREPLQNHYFTISRLHAKVICPTDFMFVAAMNPCPCGNLLSTFKECRCNTKEINVYKNKISDPLWDRLDLFVQMQEGDANTHRVDTLSLQKDVLNAFIFQKQRGQRSFNARLYGQEFEEFCIMEDEAKNILQKAVTHFGISLRQKHKILRVSR
ncbi:MAG: ATP-binding protein, partial [Helicobacter sp.]|nr:ATP-binding protein [Helicobacter sp.]